MKCVNLVQHIGTLGIIKNACAYQRHRDKISVDGYALNLSVITQVTFILTIIAITANLTRQMKLFVVF
jgi:riboflavin synthase alpha subunit